MNYEITVNQLETTEGSIRAFASVVFEESRERQKSSGGKEQVKPGTGYGDRQEEKDTPF